MVPVLVRVAALSMALVLACGVAAHFVPLHKGTADIGRGNETYKDGLWSFSFAGTSREWWEDPCVGQPRSCEDPDGYTRLRAAGPLFEAGLLVAFAALVLAFMDRQHAVAPMAALACIVILAAGFIGWSGAHAFHGYASDTINGVRGDEAGGFTTHPAAGFGLTWTMAALAGGASVALFFFKDPRGKPKRRARGPTIKFKQRERKTFELPKEEEPEGLLDAKDL